MSRSAFDIIVFDLLFEHMHTFNHYLSVVLSVLVAVLAGIRPVKNDWSGYELHTQLLTAKQACGRLKQKRASFIVHAHT